MPAICVEPRPALMLYTRISLMVRSGMSAGLTPAPCAAASPGLASDETAAADAPRNPRRELVFDIVTSYCNGESPNASRNFHSRTPPSRPHAVSHFCHSRRHATPRHGLAPLRLLHATALLPPLPEIRGA